MGQVWWWKSSRSAGACVQAAPAIAEVDDGKINDFTLLLDSHWDATKPTELMSEGAGGQRGRPRFPWQTQIRGADKQGGFVGAGRVEEDRAGRPVVLSETDWGFAPGHRAGPSARPGGATAAVARSGHHAAHGAGRPTALSGKPQAIPPAALTDPNDDEQVLEAFQNLADNRFDLIKSAWEDATGRLTGWGALIKPVIGKDGQPVPLTKRSPEWQAAAILAYHLHAGSLNINAIFDRLTENLQRHGSLPGAARLPQPVQDYVDALIGRMDSGPLTGNDIRNVDSAERPVVFAAIEASHSGVYLTWREGRGVYYGRAADVPPGVTGLPLTATDAEASVAQHADTLIRNMNSGPLTGTGLRNLRDPAVRPMVFAAIQTRDPGVYLTWREGRSVYYGRAADVPPGVTGLPLTATDAEASVAQHADALIGRMDSGPLTGTGLRNVDPAVRSMVFAAIQTWDPGVYMTWREGRSVYYGRAADVPPGVTGLPLTATDAEASVVQHADTLIRNMNSGPFARNLYSVDPAVRPMVFAAIQTNHSGEYLTWQKGRGVYYGRAADVPPGVTGLPLTATATATDASVAQHAEPASPGGAGPVPLVVSSPGSAAYAPPADAAVPRPVPRVRADEEAGSSVMDAVLPGTPEPGGIVDEGPGADVAGSSAGVVDPLERTLVEWGLQQRPVAGGAEDSFFAVLVDVVGPARLGGASSSDEVRAMLARRLGSGEVRARFASLVAEMPARVAAEVERRMQTERRDSEVRYWAARHFNVGYDALVERFRPGYGDAAGEQATRHVEELLTAAMAQLDNELAMAQVRDEPEQVRAAERAVAQLRNELAQVRDGLAMRRANIDPAYFDQLVFARKLDENETLDVARERVAEELTSKYLGRLTRQITGEPVTDAEWVQIAGQIATAGSWDGIGRDLAPALAAAVFDLTITVIDDTGARDPIGTGPTAITLVHDNHTGRWATIEPSNTRPPAPPLPATGTATGADGRGAVPAPPRSKRPRSGSGDNTEPGGEDYLAGLLRLKTPLMGTASTTR